MKKWSASKYRAAKKRYNLANVTPEWVKNPETGQEFYLRRVGAMAAMLAGYIHTVSNVADESVAAWKEKGVDIGDSAPLALVTPEKIAEGEREMRMMARVVAEACVIPKLVSNPAAEDELDPAELDDRDVLFIFRYATGQVGSVKGGGVANMGDIATFRKKPGLRARTRNDGTELRDSAEPVAQAG